MKKAYVVAEILVADSSGYEEYKPLSTASVAKFGGKFLVRGGARDQHEGADSAHSDVWRTVIVEFPSKDHAQGWYDSVEYARAKEIRQATSISRLFIVEGV